MTKLLATAMVLLFSMGQGMAAAPPAGANASGEWLVADATARIRIGPCGTVLCGTISWTKAPPGVDENNPDPAKRSRPIMGVEILSGMTPAGPNRWKGSVYNAQNGKTYDAMMSLESADVLRIEGCVLGGLLCGGENWTRAGETTGSVRPARPAPAR
jgi:uncharacterized protein (DUF2147 family)